MRNEQLEIVSFWREPATNGYTDFAATRQVTELCFRGRQAFVREATRGRPSFEVSSNARIRLKQEGASQQVLELAAVERDWYDLADVVEELDSQHRTIVRNGRWSSPTAVEQRAPRLVRVGLVGCCSRKLDVPAPAERLYRSPLFVLCAAYARRHCDTWAILSAKHGLVRPLDLVEPYDLALSSLSAGERAAWADRVHFALRDWAAELGRVRFVALAGATYRRALDRLPHEAPLARLGIGEQLAALSRDGAAPVAVEAQP